MKKEKKYLFLAGLYGLLLVVFSSSMISYNTASKIRPLGGGNTSEERTKLYWAIQQEVEALYTLPMQIVVLLLLIYSIFNFLLWLKNSEGYDEGLPKNKVLASMGLGTAMFLCWYYLFAEDGAGLFRSMNSGKTILFTFFVCQIIAHLSIHWKQHIDEILIKIGAKYWLILALIAGVIILILWNMEWIYEASGRDELFISVVFSAIVLYFLFQWLSVFLFELQLDTEVNEKVFQIVFMGYIASFMFGAIINCISGLDFGITGYRRIFPLSFTVVCCCFVCCTIFYFNYKKPSKIKKNQFGGKVLDEGFYEEEGE